MSWKMSVCNEMFANLQDSTAFTGFLGDLRESGFDGVEFAPFSIFGDFSGNCAGLAVELKTILNGENLEFAGFHWLLASPEGLHISSADKAVRNRSRDHLLRLSELASILGSGPLVLGSPGQRSSAAGEPVHDAVSRLTDTVRTIADRIAADGNRLLLEAVDHRHTDVLNTLEEVRSVLREINHSAIGGMFDFNNCSDEKDDWPELITRHREFIGHVHLNTPGGGYPEKDNQWMVSYRKAFGKLAETGYSDWVSLEIFEKPENGRNVLQETRKFLESVV